MRWSRRKRKITRNQPRREIVTLNRAEREETERKCHHLSLKNHQKSLQGSAT